MNSTTIILVERYNLGMMKHNQQSPPDISPRRQVPLSQSEVFENLKAAGYVGLLRLNDDTIVVGVSERDLLERPQETLDSICTHSLGEPPMTTSSSQAGLASFRGNLGTSSEA